MRKRTMLLPIATLLLIGIVSATTTSNPGGANLVTMKGPLGILVPIGIEQVAQLTASQIIFFYNFISVGILFLMSAVASERNLRHFTFLIPALAAMLVFFGWMQAPNPALTWSIVVAMGFLAGLLYMKESLRENWGIGGPGTTIMNIAAYLLLFNVVTGVVVGSGLFNQNVIGTPPEMNGINIQQSVQSMSNSGGWLQQLLSDGSLLLTAGIGAVQNLLNIFMAVAWFPGMVTQCFPVLAGSGMVMSLIYLFTVGEYVLWAKLFYDIVWTKSPWIEI